jgi:hypothetical protein
MQNENGHDHDHDHENEEVVAETVESVEVSVAEQGEHVGHTHSGESLWDTTLEITFGIEHMFAEFFWNAVFLVVGFAVSKAVALRKIHKYIDDKHGVEHEKDNY